MAPSMVLIAVIIVATPVTNIPGVMASRQMNPWTLSRCRVNPDPTVLMIIITVLKIISIVGELYSYRERRNNYQISMTVVPYRATCHQKRGNRTNNNRFYHRTSSKKMKIIIITINANPKCEFRKIVKTILPLAFWPPAEPPMQTTGKSFTCM